MIYNGGLLLLLDKTFLLLVGISSSIDGYSKFSGRAFCAVPEQGTHVYGYAPCSQPVRSGIGENQTYFKSLETNTLLACKSLSSPCTCAWSERNFTSIWFKSGRLKYMISGSYILTYMWNHMEAWPTNMVRPVEEKTCKNGRRRDTRTKAHISAYDQFTYKSSLMTYKERHVYVLSPDSSFLIFQLPLCIWVHRVLLADRFQIPWA